MENDDLKIQLQFTICSADNVLIYVNKPKIS